LAGHGLGLCLAEVRLSLAEVRLCLADVRLEMRLCLAEVRPGIFFGVGPGITEDLLGNARAHRCVVGVCLMLD
jgi:hypothetical protein